MTLGHLDSTRLFWRLQSAGWVACCLLGVGFGAVYFSLGEALALFLPRSVFGFLVTCGLRYAYRPLVPMVENIWLGGGALFLFCGALAFLDGAFITLVLQQTWEGRAIQQFFVSSIFMRWMVYWLWSLLYLGIKFWLRTQHAQLRLARAEADARASELRFLQAQINPHFLFNALNTIVAESDNEATRALVRALAEYLRFAARRHDVAEALGEEVDAVACYLEVERARFEERFQFDICIDEQARQFFVPPAIILPLVENAVKYGRRTSPVLHVLIEAQCRGEGMTLRVRNSGEWVPPGGGGSTETGLENLRRRLHLFFEEKATLSLTHGRGEVVATLYLPFSLPSL